MSYIINAAGTLISLALGGSSSEDLLHSVGRAKVLLESFYSHPALDEEAKKLKRELLQKIVDAEKDGQLTREKLYLFIRQAFLARVFSDLCTCNSLPLRLRRLTQDQILRVLYLRADHQPGGWECGIFSVFNAAALKHEMQSPETSKLSHERLRATATGYIDRQYPCLDNYVEFINGNLLNGDRSVKVGEAELDLSHILYLSKHPAFHLENLELRQPDKKFYDVILVCLKDNQVKLDACSPHPVCQNYANSLAQTTSNGAWQGFVEEELERQFEVANRENRAAHITFLCHIKNPAEHYLKISPVKLKNIVPFLLILDSFNFSIDESADAKIYIEYFYDKFIQRLPAI